MSAAIMASLILWLISPVLGNTLRYIILALVLVLLFAVAVDCQTPTHKLVTLDRAIKLAEDTLIRALAECLRDRIEPQLLSSSLTHVEITVCDIRTELLSMGSLDTWTEYIRTMQELLKSIAKCAKKVEEIRLSVLRIVEAERKYNLQVGRDVRNYRRE
ncbi:hypothetical protein C8R46DRAFT_1223461 [Mycena filopes]|nr:hypothetical protein C8R46DRAFT_1223461 [Mycena filopes]